MDIYSKTNKLAVSVCNRALLLCGLETINDFEKETPETYVCSNFLTSLVDKVLTQNIFTFSVFYDNRGDGKPKKINEPDPKADPSIYRFGDFKADELCDHLKILRFLGDNAYVYRVPLIEWPEYCIQVLVYEMALKLAEVFDLEKKMVYFTKKIEDVTAEANNVNAESFENEALVGSGVFVNAYKRSY